MKAPYRSRLPSAGKLLALAVIALVIAFVVMTFFSAPKEPLRPGTDSEPPLIETNGVSHDGSSDGN